MMAAMQPKESGELSMFIKMLMDDRARQADELKELRTMMMTQQKQPGILEQLAVAMPQLENVAKLIGFKKGGTAAAEGTNWGDVAEKAIDKLAPLATAFMAGRGAGPGMPADRGFILNPAPQAQPTADGTAPEAAAAEGQQTTPEQDQQRLTAIWQEFQGLLTAIAPFLVNEFRAMESSGYRFRDWLIENYGTINWKTLRQKVSIPDFVALSQRHPQLKEALSPPEDFAEFLTEVFTEPGKEPADALQTAEED
jgi:hypothetical protein